MTSVITVKELTKIYPPKERGGAPFIAVDRISFALKSGEILGLLGPNGAGKTTTIQMLLSTLTPTSGSIDVLGMDFFKHRSEALQTMGFASTYANMPENLTVYENLLINGRIYGLSREQCKARAEKFLKGFAVWDQKDKTVRALSSGQKTRVLLAKAFMTHPKIVLLDEPTAALDPEIAKEVRSFILNQQREHGTSVLFTSHNMEEVAELCDRILVLKNGVIIADNSPEALAASVSMTRLILTADQSLEQITTFTKQQELMYDVQERSITIHIQEQKIANFLSSLAQQGIEYTHIWIEKPSLEDYFLQIATKDG